MNYFFQELHTIEKNQEQIFFFQEQFQNVATLTDDNISSYFPDRNIVILIRIKLLKNILTLIKFSKSNFL